MNVKKIAGIILGVIVISFVIGSSFVSAQETWRERRLERWKQWREQKQQERAESRAAIETYHPDSQRDYEFSLEHGGLTRYYKVHIPPSHNKNVKIPVIIALHGHYGTGENMRKLTLNVFDQLSDMNNFIVVYPDGIDQSWNDSGGISPASKKDIDDVGFIRALIEELEKRYNIDSDRVYVTGISNGAYFSHRLGCELSDRIAAIAPVAGTMPECVSANCSPMRPVPIMMFHGTEDPYAVYGGGKTAEGRIVLSAEDTAKYWARKNSCDLTPTRKDLPDNFSDGTTITETSYGNCKEDAAVMFYAINGGGHAWPGGWQYLPKVIVGKTTQEINATEVIWEFFKRHALTDASGVNYGPGDHEFTMNHDGIERTYKVYAPPNYNKDILTSLIINLHGGYGSAEAAEKMTGMNQTADKQGFIVVYPNAVRGSYDEKSKMYYQHWNAGPRADSSKSPDVDDVGFISKMIDKLKEDFNIDSSRIYATGMSNGATMVYRLACQLSDKIAAFAPVAGNQLDITCNPERAVPIMHFHGLADNFATFDGKVLEDQRKPIPELILEWAERNGCSQAPVMSYPVQGVACKTYGACSEDTEIVLCTIEEAGHTWPGQGVYMGARVCEANPDGLLCKKLQETYGRQRYDFSANDAMWEFFKRHALENVHD